MGNDVMERESKLQHLAYLTDTLKAITRLSYWCYSADQNLLSTNSDDLVLSSLLTARGKMSRIAEHFKTNDLPIYLCGEFGISWGIIYECGTNSQQNRFHILGPAIGEDLSAEAVQRGIHEENIPLNFRSRFVQLLQDMPLIVPSQMFIYIQMLHYAVTGQVLSHGDVASLERLTGDHRSSTNTNVPDRMRTYMAEQAILRMVREGNINYKTAMGRATSISNGVRVNAGDVTRHAKVSGITFTTLCTRAAIEGGLTPEMAYSRGDAYIQSVLECKTATDVQSVNQSMYEDFIHLVHKARMNPQVSPAIQSCCDYIMLHVEDEFTLGDLAANSGYTKYYLSRLFKNETGVSINTYIKNARIEYAKTLLIGTDDSISDICRRLQFCNRTYFSSEFSKAVGVTPAQFRAQNQCV